MAIKYEKLNQIDHVLKRPDVYIGSTRSRNTEEFVVTNGFKIEKRIINVSPAILRIFIEPLSNAVDNFARSKQKGIKATKIEINIDEKTGETTFWNDGDIIPITIHPTEKCYNHSLIFGQLLTSSNYDDNEDRIDISGKNGIGIKATGIFSKKITVEGVDPVNKKHFIQTWMNNLKETKEPNVTNSNLKNGYTKVSYIPDFTQFGLTEYTPEIISLYKRYIVDVAMLTKLNVVFNGEEIPVKNLLDYAKLYSKNENEKNEYLNIKTENCDVVVTTSQEFEAISFANGIFTPLGGTHVDAWSEALFRPLVEKLNKPKKPQINITDVKKFFRLFVVASVNKPSFDSQSKLKLESPTVVAEVKKIHILALSKWSVMEMIEDVIRMKEMIVLKKIERGKNFKKIEGLSPANNEGGKFGRECILAIVEGDSAKTYASLGLKEGVLGKQGRDWIGIYPIRGKILNTRNATASSISKNTVICEIIQALGLKQGLDYMDEENFNKLRYGKLLIITDADVDGFHISGLIQNFFHSLFPSLLKRKESFIISMQTPIVRVFTDNQDILFYDERDYKKYAEGVGTNKKINCKYYKGLGASNKKDVIETFGRKVIRFYENEHDGNTFTKVFHKKFADQRKEWLEKYDPNNIILEWSRGNDPEIKDLSHGDFINTEMIKFSISDCARSIPNLIDGFKEGHRKVLFGCFKRKLKNTGKVIKVAQLAGSVADISAYHHGEQNLHKTIIHMASHYVGCNNIPILYRDGQFGSRAEGGKDAADARYISTKLDKLTRLIFRVEDEPLLSYKEDDGRRVEPEFYVPIIPMICVNGCITGIGTGWSSNIPCYNPLDLIECIRIWLEKENNGVSNILTNDDDIVISAFPDIKPWYRGFKGEIKLVTEGKYITYGKIEKSDGDESEEKKRRKNSCRVVELPIGTWINDFEDQLATFKEEKIIKDYKNHSDPDNADFTVIEDDEGIKCDLTNLKLTSFINTNNMVLFDANGKLKKYSNVDMIIDEYCKVRFEFYIKRKKYNLLRIEKEIKQLQNKKRFLEEVRDETIKLFTEVKNGSKITREYVKTIEIIQILNERKYEKESDFVIEYDNEKNDENENEENENEENEEKETTKKSSHGYEYLLRLQINSITKEKIDKLTNEIIIKQNEKDKLKSTSEKQIWLNELDELLKAYPSFEKDLENENVLGTKIKDEKNVKNGNGNGKKKTIRRKN